MNTLKTEPREVLAQSVSVPIAWYPRLSHGSDSERSDWRLIGDGLGIHGPQLDEDISVEGLLLGYPSNESPASIQRWLEAHPTA